MFARAVKLQTFRNKVPDSNLDYSNITFLSLSMTFCCDIRIAGRDRECQNYIFYHFYFLLHFLAFVKSNHKSIKKYTKKYIWKFIILMCCN
jgi:hypothetical protein